MSPKYGYYIITGFLPAYEQRDGFHMTTGLFRDEGLSAAQQFYANHGAKLPRTKKLVEYDKDTILYALKYDVDDLVLMVKATKPRDAVIAFDALRYLLAFTYDYYQPEAELVPLKRKPHFHKTRLQDLHDLADHWNSDFFRVELHSGIVVPHRQLLELRPQLNKVFLQPDTRRALACLYQSQLIYYTHLVGSYVSSHSRPDLIHMTREEFRQHNFQYQEMLHASLLACYRGIEAIYSKNFKNVDFRKPNRKKLELHMDAKVPNAKSRSRYRLRLYRQRETHPPKHRLVITMLEVLFRARNRAAHGYRWPRQHRFETFGSDLVDESKFFLGHLISNLLW